MVNLKHIGDVIVKAQFKGEITSYKLREKDCEKKLNLSLPFHLVPSFCLHSANTRKFISDLFVLFIYVMNIINLNEGVSQLFI